MEGRRERCHVGMQEVGREVGRGLGGREKGS